MRPWLLLAGFLAWGAAAAQPGDSFPLPAFSNAPLGSATPPGWQPVYIKGVKQRTAFSIEEDDGRRVLEIQTDASAGSLATPLDTDPAAYPRLRWRWKIPRHNPATDPRTKRGDDYPARIYVLFHYDVNKLGFFDRTNLRLARKLYGKQVPAAALCYVWDPKLPAGTALWNAYTKRVRMVVVRSGNDNLGQWVEEERDLARDFKAAFGEDAPMVSGIAAGGDGDNTGEASVAYVGDLLLAR